MDKTPTEWATEPLRKYAQFSGRARRAEYWWFWLLITLVSIIARIADYSLMLRPIGLALLVSLAVIVPHLAVAVRRLHDIGRTGWWLVAPASLGILLAIFRRVVTADGDTTGYFYMPLIVSALIVLILAVVLLVWFCNPGTAGPNRYGPDPLATD